MTWNLLMWRWSDEFDTPSKRKRKGMKFGDITSLFARTGDHPAIGDAELSEFRDAVNSAFGNDEDNRPFVFEDYGKCAVINYPQSVRFELVPKIASIGRKFGFNASEF